MSRVFLSYSHEDEAAARTAKAVLAQHGLDVWLAGDEIRAGERFADRIRDELHAATAVVLLIGKHPSNWARNEWSLALERSWNRERALNLLPVLLPGAEPPTFLMNLAYVQIVDETTDWKLIAEMIETSPAGTLSWRSSEIAKAALATRLTALEKVAALLPPVAFDDTRA